MVKAGRPFRHSFSELFRSCSAKGVLGSALFPIWWLFGYHLFPFCFPFGSLLAVRKHSCCSRAISYCFDRPPPPIFSLIARQTPCRARSRLHARGQGDARYICIYIYIYDIYIYSSICSCLLLPAAACCCLLLPAAVC
jgi:hypothetical protein